MPSRSSADLSHRSRRTHRKSRFGCKNCKAKRLKCDESRAHGGGCERCMRDEVECSFILLSAKPWTSVGRNNSINLSHYKSKGTSGSGTQRVGDDPGYNRESSIALSGKVSPLPLLFWSPRLPVWTLSLEGMPSTLHVLHHFTTATASTCGNAKSQTIAQSKVVSAALSTPYLMHAILGLASAHIRCLMPSDLRFSRSRLKVAECYYWAKALEGLRQELAGPASESAELVPCRSNVTKENMDQLLSTVMFISMHQFSLCDDLGAVTDEQSAPRSFVWLQHRSERDTALKWLGIEAGFKGLLPAMAPWLSESYWLPILGTVDFTDEFNLKALSAAFQQEGNSGDPSLDPVELHFIKLCGIEADSVDSNPYYVNLELVLWCRRMQPVSVETFTKLLNFAARMTPGFYGMLLDLDTAALLILAHWLVLMLGVGQWWITSRCLVEIREIVRFVLQGEAVGKIDEGIAVLLREPAAAVGMKI